MGNKVKYNLKNVHAAKLSKDEEGNLVYTIPVEPETVGQEAITYVKESKKDW